MLSILENHNNNTRIHLIIYKFNYSMELYFKNVFIHDTYLRQNIILIILVEFKSKFLKLIQHWGKIQKQMFVTFKMNATFLKTRINMIIIFVYNL